MTPRAARAGAFALVALASSAPNVAAQGGRADSVAAAGASSVVWRARVNPQSDVSFSALLLPDTVYVGQQATYQVGVFLSEEVRSRLRRNPQFVPPEVRSALAFDLPSPREMQTRMVGTRRYDVHVFQRALFPLTPGRHRIPSARLDYALPLSNSFFAREESHSAQTGEVLLVALEPPVAGRPPGYRGAVGRLSLSAQLDSHEGRVGDPLTLTVSVDGVGNVSLLPRPELSIAWADVVAGGERVKLDSASMLLRGRKDFVWLVTPRRSGRLRVPPVRYPYFNPYTERYEIALTPPDSVRVEAGTSVVADRAAADTTPALPIRRLYSGEVPAPLPTRGTFWLVLALAPLPALATVARERRPRRRREPSAIARLRAIVADGATDVAALRRAYAAAIAARVRATATAMSDHALLLRTLRRAGVTEQTAADAERLLAELDAVVFGRVGNAPHDAARRAVAIVRAIDHEARTIQSLASRRAGATVVLTLSVLVAGGVAWAAERDALADAAFREGIRYYDARQFPHARDAFGELAQARPRSPDAWFNFGAASWQLADTAAAAVGWHRAVRLAPSSPDVRRLLDLTPGFRDGFLGDVPPVSVTAIALIGGAVWIGGWGLVTFAMRKRRPRPRRLGWVALGAAVVVAYAGFRQSEVLSARHAAVVVTPARMRAMPTLGAEPGTEIVTGEVVRVLAAQGVWSRVALPDGRSGWIESSRIEPIGVE